MFELNSFFFFICSLPFVTVCRRRLTEIKDPEQILKISLMAANPIVSNKLRADAGMLLYLNLILLADFTYIASWGPWGATRIIYHEDQS